MASNFNIVSAVFGTQNMRDPQNYRIAALGESNDLSSGTQDFVATKKLVRRQVLIQIGFNDHDDLASMQATEWGQRKTLVIKTQDTGDAPVTKTGTILDALCVNVTGDAQHADYGQHVATFEAFATDGSTNPIGWA